VICITPAVAEGGTPGCATSTTLESTVFGRGVDLRIFIYERLRAAPEGCGG
jgi:hypothetical protein